MYSLSTVAALAAVAAIPAVSAHGYVSGIVADGVYHEGTSPGWIYGEKPNTPGWYAKNQDNGFVDGSTYTTGDIICHKDATPGATSVPVKAGGKLELQWSTWPESHHGPVIDYMARCPGDCTAVDKESLVWFKVDAGGLMDDSTVPGQWATDKLMSNNNTWEMTVPSNLAPGHFVLRHEIIALHSAGQEGGAQNYPMCINLQVTGGGSSYPCREGATCPKGTAMYKPDAPGITINIYAAIADYKIPGPPVWSGLKSAAKRVARAFSA